MHVPVVQPVFAVLLQMRRHRYVAPASVLVHE